ncbi:PhnD/SsuA/transferrin family substrate-binding protein [Oscillatoria sp. FACHB-1407]|uniref:PhnD/SsuA/transferrin family substrate-binding protein n=1 Tax=Oscillatoria sp. FACHB-1407 TaxID=2692847 RepID=UPI001689DCDD|nr:PhnD/SsuA/transferrin family substrate-binding protein [Oscillatoria sp. FACHB-1407]MBD2462981.1 PhnD/SsuA/transferrin family substrate-binding protein [Oscillatoria sp. FACHB-1407]
MPLTDSLTIASYLAPNMLWFYEAVGAYLARSLSIAVQVIPSRVDPLEDAMLLQDQCDLAFICGLPLVRYQAIAPQQLQALVAPVMQAERYGDRPVYFSDMIVNAISDITTFEQLAGTVFSYNDLGSNSGYNLMRHRLMQGGYPANFFGQVVESGSHQASMQWVAEGKATCAAIDSTVLEQEYRRMPDLARSLRVIESIGPCPIPPLVGAQRLGAETLTQLQTVLLDPDAELRSQMQRAGIRRFAAVQSQDYEAIAQIYTTTLSNGYATIL